MNKYKICPRCGAKNAPTLLDCSTPDCGYDLTRVPVSHEEQHNAEENHDSDKTEQTDKQMKFTLSSLDGCYKYEFSSNSVIVGREHDLSTYLETKPYVSRSHARLMRKDDKVIIENLSCTNFTYINNTRIQNGTLQDGDVIGLGGVIKNNGGHQEKAAYFVFNAERQ